MHSECHQCHLRPGWGGVDHGTGWPGGGYCGSPRDATPAAHSTMLDMLGYHGCAWGFRIQIGWRSKPPVELWHLRPGLRDGMAVAPQLKEAAKWGGLTRTNGTTSPGCWTSNSRTCCIRLLSADFCEYGNMAPCTHTGTSKQRAWQTRLLPQGPFGCLSRTLRVKSDSTHRTGNGLFRPSVA